MDEGQIEREPNPKQGANVLSKLFFIWTGKVFRRGLQKAPMTSDELCKPLPDDTSESLGDILEEKWFQEIKRAKEANRKPRLLNAVIRAFGWSYARLGIIHVINELFLRLSQPILLGFLLSYFTKSSNMTTEEALQVAGGMIFLIFISTVIQNHYGLGGFHHGMKVRIACCSLIYRKALRLSKTALGESSSGQVVNLLSNDVNRFDIVFFLIHYMWSAPIGAILISYFLWVQSGLSGIIGVVSIFIVVPLQSYTGKLASRFRLQTAYKTDERVRLMDEIICGIQVIKMYAWEKPFAKLISMSRAKELKILKKSSYVRGLYMTFNLFTTRFAIFSTMISLSLLGENLSADKVFVYSSYLNMLAFTMSGMYVRGFAETAEALVSMKRLTKFLTLEEITDKSSVARARVRKDGDKDSENAGEICLKGATAKWQKDIPDPTLNKVSIDVKKNSLTAIVGPVGCGKSSLLQALLGELAFEEGKITVTGTISYASQEPWVFAASVRQNITFGLPFNRIRYAEVVRVCALNQDFAQWPQGDKTVVGERGTSLSGGQRARINLARAIYKDADIYLLDDPLSAVDTHVGKHLFDECICNFLKDKTRVLVTHQIQYLEEADLIVLFNNGSVELQGTFEDLANSDLDFAQLFSIGKEVIDEEELASEFEDDKILTPVERVLRQMSVVSNRSNRSSKTPDLIESVENMATATLEEVKQESGSAFLKYFLSGASVFSLLILLCFFVLAQTSASLCDYWVSVWTTQDLLRKNYAAEFYNRTRLFNVTASYNNNEEIYNLNETEHYYKINETDDMPIFDPSDYPDLLSAETCQLIYTGLIVALFFIAITRSLIFYNTCIRCSQNLHDAMFKTVSESYMSFFFNNPSGRILNRFSKDLGSIDELLPKALLDAGQIIMVVVGAIIVTITINYIFLFPTLIVCVLGGLARWVFLRTSKNLKRIEGITRSPVFTHLNATLQGLTTIRAYQAETILKHEFDKHQDLHTAAWYLFIATSTAFGFTLDFLCFLLIAFITFLLLLIETSLFGGQVGLAITQTMALSGMVQWGMRQSAEISNQLTSVERVLEYTEMDTEKNLDSTPMEKENEKKLDSWPSEGKVEFRNMYFYYKEGEPPAIKDLCIVIKPAEKIGIVGRTGAGKSSIISALFRLAKIEGGIIIDGIDTSEVSLQRLRSKISIIPQEPMLFSGTIRRNLDPFQSYSDAELWLALEQVELKDALTSGLDTPVMDGGSNFSVGQKQLLCLARAILRKNKVLLLDEATASVDPHTDALIQKTIRYKFAECTVCTIAHRLNTIMDSDRILVMDNGRLAEFDKPYTLLQKPSGTFTKMVLQTGPVMAEQLRKAAEESYKK